MAVPGHTSRVCISSCQGVCDSRREYSSFQLWADSLGPLDSLVLQVSLLLRKLFKGNNNNSNNTSRRYYHGRVDIYHNKGRNVWHRKPRDIFLRLLVKLYRFLRKQTNTTFNQVVLKRLFMSPPWQSLSLSQMIWKMKLPSQEGKTPMVVGTTINDMHVQEVTKQNMCTLYVSSCAWSCIFMVGGQILAFDHLALNLPKSSGTVLLSGPRKGGEVYKHFGKAPGIPHSHTKPYIRSKGWKFECTRGLWASHSYKTNAGCDLVIKKILDAEKMK
ncbi:LOW QUALITY PROTEIN: 60S ribosomal protein L18-like [Pteronotus mesoamericanus]|uniref:LOW QUALITY PROTEIN: 60S ribosomal protein L18-like n=1 Tax=Pteronotus mesoamericanus TaxID=1884717 RepID=UPI0023ED5B67|nr:LOW QUALITY PROTEIN: 60S ribosomal protein L18-like [Pteronotus parnellii mesoamericanus]